MERKQTFKPGRYYVITFVATFAFWMAGAVASHRDGRGGMYMALMLPGMLAPFIISLVMTFASGGRAARREFVSRLFDPRRFNLRNMPIFFLIMPSSVLIALFVSLIFGGSIDQLKLAEGFSFSAGGMSVLVLLLLAAAFEELGWRGYAFDSLLSRFNVFRACLVFSILWSFWHLPLVFVYGSYQWEILQQNLVYALNFFIGIIPMGFIISWICMKNGKSIIATILFHFVVNMSQEALAITQLTKCIQTGVLALFAVLIVLHDRELFFGNNRTGDSGSSDAIRIEAGPALAAVGGPGVQS